MFLKVEIFIPEGEVYPLMDAINDKGFIREGDYDYAFSVTPVLGHWRPLDQANPFIGEKNQISKEEEKKIEFRIDKEDYREVKALILDLHPYEEPVIHFIPLYGEDS